MPRARKTQVSLTDTPYYHCVSRCVRRTFLCGKDPLTGQCYEHRRGWVEQRLLFLAKVFAIDICAYAVMSNHTHVVLHVDAEQAQCWSLEEVITRWHQVCKGNYLSNTWLDENQRSHMDEAQLEAVVRLAEDWRKRLYDISWFMRLLNEPIARKANQEDGCTGRFWEGRFKSQALLDEAALAACMAYVDLNPVRAGTAKTPETSAHTSIKKRAKAAISGYQPKALLPFVGNPRANMPKGLPFVFTDYLLLVDETGRAIRYGKKGCISANARNIVSRLGLSAENWLELTCHLEQRFSGAIGKEHLLREYHHHIGQRRTHGISVSRRLLKAA
ncbi:mobile element protein [Photobacterium aphoticum]|uniref:Mobile element protein n=1 Tax=Photobacterium aphoticum TaxID=754436 RepID=A0A090QUU9_9GAMM|nr:mobile element protein [Photobacterium aphoticum]